VTEKDENQEVDYLEVEAWDNVAKSIMDEIKEGFLISASLIQAQD